MGLSYKPTQRRGKKVVYQSIDPNEGRAETIKALKVIGIGLGIMLLWGILADLS